MNAMHEIPDYDLAMLKSPPYSLEAEQAVIGGLLIAPNSFDAVTDLITENDFFKPDHRAAFAAIAYLADAGQPHDIVTVCDMLSAAGKLDQAGGFAYLADVAKNTPSAANIRAYANAVRERAALRNLIIASQEIADAAYEPGERTANELVDEAQRRILEIGERGDAEADLHVTSALKDYVAELDRRYNCDGLAGLSTGFRDLDARTNGLSPSDLVILAGRPGSGKTTLAMNIAEHVAIIESKPVLVFSMEMSRVQLLDRMVASVGKIPFSLLRSGKVFNHNEYKPVIAASRIKQAPLYIDDRGGLSIAQMRSTARRQHKKTPLSLIVVDYLQLARAKAENRVNEITVISQGLKAIAKEIGCPVIALSQLSRKCEEQKRRPISSDLRDSGSIEQDADSIFLIYRDEVYNEETNLKGVAEIHCTKLRNGEPGMDFLKSNLAMCKFENHEPGYRPPEPEQEQPRRKGGFGY